MRETTARSVQEMIDGFESFDRCGPKLPAAFRVVGSDRPIEVIADKIDWGHITQGRPVRDCRVSNLADLMPSARQVLRALQSLDVETPVKKSGMSFG